MLITEFPSAWKKTYNHPRYYCYSFSFFLLLSFSISSLSIRDFLLLQLHHIVAPDSDDVCKTKNEKLCYNIGRVTRNTIRNHFICNNRKYAKCLIKSDNLDLRYIHRFFITVIIIFSSSFLSLTQQRLHIYI